jgi:hypothetical protein
MWMQMCRVIGTVAALLAPFCTGENGDCRLKQGLIGSVYSVGPAIQSVVHNGMLGLDSPLWIHRLNLERLNF